MTQHQPTPPYKPLRRPTSDRVIAGVCSGLGRYFDVDPVLVRVIFAVAVVFTGGFALLAYPVLWFVMPEDPAATVWVQPPTPPTGPPAPPTAPPAAAA
jgi:phage shock protein C